MLYRKFPRVPHEVSILGFGCMRLPTEAGQQAGGKIDVPEAVRMIRTAIDDGVNYIDTAYPYHNGESEAVVGKALEDGYREKVFLATKLPVWLVTSREDMDKYLDEQLARLHTDHLDFYLLHGLGAEVWKSISRLGVLEFLDSAKADGRIRYPGFSFHDEFSVFKEIVDSYEWSFAQIQYNYMDEENQAGTQGLEYAAKRGHGIVIMEPLRGGLLSCLGLSILSIPDKVVLYITPINKKIKVGHTHDTNSTIPACPACTLRGLLIGFWEHDCRGTLLRGGSAGAAGSYRTVKCLGI
jgi:hypothetical protein